MLWYFYEVKALLYHMSVSPPLLFNRIDLTVLAGNLLTLVDDFPTNYCHHCLYVFYRLLWTG